MVEADATEDFVGSSTVVLAAFLTPGAAEAAQVPDNVASTAVAGGVVAAGGATVEGLAEVESGPAVFTVRFEELGSTATSRAAVEDMMLVDRDVTVAGTVLHEDSGTGDAEDVRASV